MTPAFGFSMGDFISAIGLVKKVSKALKETGGASTEYQLVVIELKSLKNILRHLETLQPSEDNVTHINANWQMYQVLLKIQQNTAHSPTGLLESNIRFEDALGDYRELPYEYFRHWEPFEGFLRAQFKHKIGERKVIEGQYHIIDIGNSRTIVKKEHWTRSIKQGATLTMSMVMSHLHRKANSCPRPSCPSGELEQCPSSGRLLCKNCYLKFYPKLEGLDKSSSKIEEERRQNEECLRLFGRKLKPVDAPEVDVVTELPNLHTKETSAKFSNPFDEPEIAHKTESNSETQGVFATWAVPAVVPELSHRLGEMAGTEIELVNAEIREIESFRNVHLAGGFELVFLFLG